MSNDANGDWVRARTPREEGDEWTEEQSEYGLAVEPGEWDDYASDQSVPVTPPQPRPRPEVVEPAPGEQAPGVIEPTGEELLQSPEALQEQGTADPELDADRVDPDRDLHPVAEPQETADDVGELPGHEQTETVPVIIDGEPEEQFLEEQHQRGETSAADDDLDTTVVRNQPLFDETDDASSAEEPQAPTASDPDGTGFPREAVGAAGVGAAGAAALAYGDSEPVEGRDADREVRDDVLDGGHQDEAVESVTAEGEVRTGHGVEDSDDQAAESIETDAVGGARHSGLGDEAARWDEEPAGESAETQAMPAVAERGDDDVDDGTGADGGLPDDDDTRVLESSRDDDYLHRDARTSDEDETRVSQGALGDEPLPRGDAGTGDVGATAETGMAGIYRGGAGDDTQVLDKSDFPDDDEREAEERRIQEQLAAERRARQERLGVVPTSSDNETRATPVKPTPTTDKWHGAFGLFVLRLITAVVVGVTGYQMLTPIQETVAALEPTMIPEPRLAAWIAGFTLAFLAILLVLGFAQRLVGLLLMVYGIGMLVFVRWGTFNPFLEGFEGFVGDKELLLVGIGLLLLLLGGGRWGIDGAIRGSRARSRAERQN